MALQPSEACDPERESFSERLPDGWIFNQTGHVDTFATGVECRDSEGCNVMLKVSYHPHFVVTRVGTGERIPTFAVAPSYIGFRAPFGTDAYRVEWVTPAWSTFLFWSCYSWMIGSVVAHMVELYWPARLVLSSNKKRD